MEGNLRLDWQLFVKEAVRRRKEQGLTQKDLAIFVGVSKPTVSNFEQGRQNISVQNALKILHALGLAS